MTMLLLRFTVSGIFGMAFTFDIHNYTKGEIILLLIQKCSIRGLSDGQRTPAAVKSLFPCQHVQVSLD